MQKTLGPLVAVVRAIGAEFIRRTLKPLLLTAAVIAGALLILGGWLTTVNAWWWILEVLFIIGAMVLLGLTILTHGIVRMFDPQQSSAQKHAVSAFVDKLQRIADNLQTPQIIILYRIIRDIVRPRPHTFVETVAHDSKELAPDFASLCRQFE